MPLLIRRLPAGPYETNAYVVACLTTLEAVLIDPADDPERLLEGASGFRVRYIVVTHGHSDHTGALAAVRETLGAPLAYHPADKTLIKASPDIELAGSTELPLGEYTMRVLHLPGHTPGGVGLLVGIDLFGGDTLFPGGPGRTNSPEDLAELVRTIKDRLFTLPDETAVYPGHGTVTTIGREREASRAFMAKVEGGWESSGDLTWESP